MSIDEDDFHDRVLDELQKILPAEWIRSEVVLPRTQRRADIVVDIPDLPLGFVVELEDRPEDVIGGAGQAVQYAGELGRGYFPAVGYPRETADPALQPEIETVSEYLPVLAL